MSELKAIPIPKMTSIFGHVISLTEYYLKSEADKVIAEKDAKILALDAEVFKQKHHAKLFLDERNYVESQLRHANYKRCLAMAKWCSSCRFAWSFIPEDDEVHKSDFYKKWEKRWMELAEKFKEAK